MAPLNEGPQKETLVREMAELRSVAVPEAWGAVSLGKERRHVRLVESKEAPACQ